MSVAALFCTVLVTAAPRQDAEPATNPSDQSLIKASQTSADKRPAKRVDIGLIPSLSFGSDLGLGLGASGALFFRHPGYTPYQYSLRLRGLYATAGYHNYAVELDAPSFLRSQWRLSGSIAYVRDLYRPFYGLGNQSKGGTAAATTTDAPASVQRGEAYDFEGPQASIYLRRNLTRRWSISSYYRFGLQRIRHYQASLLEEANLAGAKDGRVGIASVGIIYDSRNEEASASDGVYLSAAIQGGAPWLGSSFSFYGVALSVQGYLAPFGTPLLVLAARLKLDGLWGRVPISELPSIGGAISVRGLARSRYQGNVALIDNIELRSRIVRLEPWSHLLDFWLAAFVDGGRTWDGRVVDGPLSTVHGSYGGGVRFAWEEDFVVRFDVGIGQQLGLYIGLGQMF